MKITTTVVISLIYYYFHNTSITQLALCFQNKKRGILMSSSKVNNNDEINYYEAIEIELPESLEKFIIEWKEKPGNLIAVLHKVQEEYGYIPRKVAMKVSQLLDQPLAKIYGVVTFYHLFKLTKPGKHKVQVCMGTACYLKGANDLILELEKILGTGVGGTTQDGKFSFETVRCVGCCGLAPVIMIGDDVYGNLKNEDVASIISRYSNK